MKKVIPSIVLALVLYLPSTARANHQDTPPDILGTSTPHAGTSSHPHENDPSIAAAVAMQVITMLVQGGVIR